MKLGRGRGRGGVLPAAYMVLGARREHLLIVISRNDNEACDTLAAQKSERLSMIVVTTATVSK